MAISYTIDAGKVIVGPAEVKIGAYGASEGACTSIGATDGGVSLTVEQEYLDIEVDQAMGEIENKLTKRRVRFSTNMAQVTLANLALAMGLPTTAVSGSVLSVGVQLPENKTVWLIGPGPDGTVHKYHIFKARVMGNPEMAYRKDEKTVIPLEITGVIDTAQASGQELMMVTEVADDTTPPTVSSTSPTDGQSSVAVSSNIEWTMSESMDAASINTKNVYVIKASDGTVVAGTVTYTESTKKVTFDPTSNLDASTAYIAVLTTNVRDLAYNYLAGANVINFTTA